MSLIELKQFSFMGKPYFGSDMDPDGSFESCWQEFYQSPEFNELFDKLMAKNHSVSVLGIVHFSPDSFIYWIGFKSDKEDFFPKDWRNLVLPAGSAYQVSEPGLSWRSVPIEFAINLVYNSAQEAKVDLPQSIGHTKKPYFIEEVPLDKDLSEPKIHKYCVYLGSDQEALED